MYRPITALCALLFLASCGEDDQGGQAEPAIRAIKSIVVTARAGHQARRISGVTEAEVVTDLAFEISGRVLNIPGEIGDTVAEGDLIAEIDREPYLLKVEKARGKVDDARAQLRDAAAKYGQQRQLFDQGFASKAAFDSARAKRDTAESGVDVALSELQIAQRDLKLTKLLAPLDGRISEKHVEKFTEVSPGQKIVQVSSSGRLEVNVSVPETLVRNLKLGADVGIEFPTMPGRKATGKIAEIGARAGTGNAFPVTIKLDEDETALQAGMTAEVTFTFQTAATGRAFMLPLTAVLPGSEHETATIFVYDKDASVVRKRMVTIVNLRDNDLEVAGEIQEGDIVAIAGVSFLADGMKVNLLDPGQAGPVQ